MLLLTGSTGFTGSYLLYELIKNKYQVRAMKREKSNFRQIELAYNVMNKNSGSGYEEYLKKIQWIDGSFTDISSLDEVTEGVDEILHCGAYVSFNRKEKQALYKTNVEGTSNLLNLAIKKGISKFHFVSSIAALDRDQNNYSNEEMFPVNKKFSSAYSHSKYLAEMEVWRAYNEGLKGVIVNPGVILGPVIETHSINKIMRMIERGFKFYTEGVNGYVDVRDVASFTTDLIMNENNYCQRYLLVSENISYKELFNMMAASLGVKSPSIKAPVSLAKLIAVIDQLRSEITGKDPMITKELVTLIKSVYHYDSTKVKTKLNRMFIPIIKSINEMAALSSKEDGI